MLESFKKNSNNKIHYEDIFEYTVYTTLTQSKPEKKSKRTLQQPNFTNKIFKLLYQKRNRVTMLAQAQTQRDKANKTVYYPLTPLVNTFVFLMVV